MNYYQKNKMNRLAYQKEYYQQNKEEIKKYTKDYYEANKEQLKLKRKLKSKGAPQAKKSKKHTGTFTTTVMDVVLSFK